MAQFPPGVIIKEAALDDLPAVSEVAKRIWRVHYPGIISEEQIEYMLARRYTPESLRFQVEFLGHRYFIALLDQKICGFVSFTNVVKKGEAYLYVHRLYLLPELHGRGIGKALMDHAARYARDHGHVRVRLNVHRENPSTTFYLRYGFKIQDTVDIPYGQYTLNDYVMELALPD